MFVFTNRILYAVLSQPWRILCFKEYTNYTTGSKFTAIVINGWILHVG